MNRKFVFLFLCLGLLASAAFSQDGIKEMPVKREVSPELKKEAADFLRNTAVEVNNMRTLENRISFSAEMAGLMWFHNEAEARAMYQNVIGNFRNLLGQYDGDLNALGVGADEGTSLPPFGASGSAGSKVFRKFVTALRVREQITIGLAEHDPQLALDFFTETGEAVSNPMMRKQIDGSDSYFQTRLLSMIAERDPATALKFARKGLAKGINYETIALLKKLYQKDPDKGIEFGQDIIGRIKSDPPKREELYLISSLLYADEAKDMMDKTEEPEKNKPPIFSPQSKREIADVLARRVLEIEDLEKSEVGNYLGAIEQFAPARAAQIRAKFNLKKSSGRDSADLSGGPPPPKAMPTPMVSPTPEGNDPDKQIEETFEKLGQKDLPEEERRAVIERARNIIDSIGDREKKIAGLSMLALQIAQLGDKKLASEILDDAHSLISVQPINYRDYLETWALVGGYAKVDPEKAFPLLENTIYRLNDTIAAFVKVGEFIDVEGEMVQEGEVQLGSFGGGLTRELLGGLGEADTTVLDLALADFKRTKDLTNRFDRPEVRVLAKMLVLRAILGNDDKAKTEEDQKDVGF
ncbi:MAG: hypothetical protein R2747_01540 [Pyrinomonadaceae bacterium]